MAWEKGVAQTVDVPTWKDGILTAPSGTVTATIIKDGAGPIALNGSVAKIGTSPAVHLALSSTDTNCACGCVLVTDSGGGMDDVQFSFTTEDKYTAALAAALAVYSAGSGASAITLTVRKGGVAVQGVPVSLQCTGGVNILNTNGSGQVTFNRDNGTYAYAIEDTAAYIGATGSVVVASGAVTSPVGGILTITAISLPVPSSADNYVVYGIERGLDGNALMGSAAVTVKVVDCDPSCLYTAADGELRHLIGTEFETDANGQWSFNIAKTAVATRKEIALSFEYTAGTPTKVVKAAWMDETVANASDQIAFAAWKPRIRSGTG